MNAVERYFRKVLVCFVAGMRKLDSENFVSLVVRRQTARFGSFTGVPFIASDIRNLVCEELEMECYL